jgi:hypothetical protein
MNNKRTIIWTLAGALTLVILLLAVTGVWAEPNPTTLAAPSAPLTVFSNTISFQGRLLDSVNNPVNGTPVITFRVYTQPIDGTPVWEDGYSVPVENGLFNAGLEIPPSLFDGQALWLGIQVEGDAQEMTPRQQLLPAPYALYAKGAPWDGLTDVPPDMADGDDDTLYSDGIGLSLTGTTFEISTTYRLPQVCGDSDIPEWNATGGTWDCGSDDVGGGEAAWLLSGNTGTTPSTDVLGTTDAVSLTLVVNGVPALRLEPAAVPNIIGGYWGNSVASGVQGATIGGGGISGDPNRVTAHYGTISGGEENTASGTYATIGGGEENTVTGDYVVIGGGVENNASGTAGTIGGGGGNMASGDYTTISGGAANTASGDHAAIGGGTLNDASGTYAIIGGGYNNTANSDYATVGGGTANVVSGYAATVSGGYANTADGDYSFAAGYNAQANHTGSFVWSDSKSPTVFASQHSHQFRARAYGGFWFGDGEGLWIEMALLPSTPISTSTGAYLSGGGVWTNSSDRNLKENFEPVDGQDVLDRLARLPISTWNYKTGNPDGRHMGPVAQDFYATFGLGDDDRHIAAMDTSGVALVAIKELYAKNQALAAENAALQTRVEDLETENVTQEKALDDLETRLAALERGGMPQATSTLTTWWPLAGVVVLTGVVVARRRQHRPEL